MSEPKEPQEMTEQSVVMRSERDVVFEQAIFEWWQERGRQLLADPNHEEFQIRYDEHASIFVAMLSIKHSMLSDAGKRQVAESIISSFSDD